MPGVLVLPAVTTDRQTRTMGKQSRLSRLRHQRGLVAGGASTRPELALRTAASLHGKGDLVRAQSLYRQVLRSQPQNFDARRAVALGFAAETSFDDIIRAHIEDELDGKIVA